VKNIIYHKVKQKILKTIFAILTICGFLFYNTYVKIYQKQTVNLQTDFFLKYIKTELNKCNYLNIPCFEDFLQPKDIGNKEKLDIALQKFILKHLMRNPYFYLKEPSLKFSSLYKPLFCNKYNYGSIIISNDGIKIRITTCFPSSDRRYEEIFITKQSND
jgi:hypothetical protein